jgi:LysM repeat protein
MAYSVYLDGVLLPVTPSKIQTKIKNQNKTVNLINEGEVNILKSAGLTEVAFEVLIPQVKYPFAVYPNGFKKAEYYLNKFEQLKTSKQPFQFICSRVSPSGALLFETNLKVSLEEYEIEESADNGTDITVTIRLKQYKPYGTKEIKIVTIPTATAVKSTATITQSRPTESAPKAKTYTVVKGDCLWNIAKKYLGDGARYTEIYNLNKDKIKSPNLIYPGQVLTLPT